jgi:hypothetical protein
MKSSLLPLVLLATSVIGTNAKSDDSVSTTPIATEQPKANLPTFEDQKIYFINGNATRVRATPDMSSRVLGELSLNDKVRVVNPAIINDKFIEVTVVKTYDQVLPSEKFFVLIDTLSPKFIDYKEFTGKYFVVVNVASETLRMYERNCSEQNVCKNHLILESEVVVGEDTDHPKDQPGKGRSILGSYRVVGWTKFYQDPEGHYPSWYRDGYPAVPAPDANWSEWFSKKVMPLDKEGKPEGKMRGAFGWYTAFVEPEPYGQWLHGTLGWGSDHDKYIKKVKTPLINVVSDPRSSGCTRNPNEVIAFVRKMIDIGAPIIKVYAKEAIQDSTLSEYPGTTADWQYVLTKNRNHAVDRNDVITNLKITSQDLDAYTKAIKDGGALVLDPKSPLNQILEAGTFTHDIHPDAVEYTPGEKMGAFGRKLGRKGNVYGVKSQNMHGTFYVDTGLLQDYAHPNETVEVSGFADEVTPPWMKFTTSNN